MLMILVDKLGRRWTMISGNLVMCGTFIVSTTLLAKFPPSSNNTGAHWGFIVMTSWVYTVSSSTIFSTERQLTVS
jgi:hypothetical protein